MRPLTLGAAAPIIAPGARQLSSQPKDSPEKILDAARQFEALLMGQLLQGMNDGEGDGWGGEDDAEDSMIGGIGQQQFALALSQRGGLGLAQSIADGLTRSSAHQASRQD